MLKTIFADYIFVETVITFKSLGSGLYNYKFINTFIQQGHITFDQKWQ